MAGSGDLYFVCLVDFSNDALYLLDDRTRIFNETTATYRDSNVDRGVASDRTRVVETHAPFRMLVLHRLLNLVQEIDGGSADPTGASR